MESRAGLRECVGNQQVVSHLSPVLASPQSPELKFPMASQGQNLGSNSDDHGGMSFWETLLCINLSLRTKDLETLKFLCTGLVFKNCLESFISASDLLELLLVRKQLS